MASAVNRWWSAFSQWLPMRAWRRYTRLNGGTLAGGAAYFAFFAVFPAIGVGATVAGIVLRDRQDLQDRLVASVNTALNARLIGARDGDPGLLNLQDLTRDRVLTTTGVIAVAGLVLAGLGWLGAVRAGVSTVFGQPVRAIHPVLAVLRDLGLLATVGAAVLATVAAGVTVTAITQDTLGWLGLDGSAPARLAFRAGGVLVLMAADVGLLLVFWRLLSGVRVPVRDLLGSALAGGVAIGVLRLFGGILLARASSNHALAAVSTAVVGLLLWFNLLARASLLAASVGATVATDRGHLAPLPLLPSEAAPAAGEVAGAVGILAVAGTMTVAGPSGGVRPVRPEPVQVPAPPPSFGARSQDRVAIAAGAVLGATTVVAGQVLARGGRALGGLLAGRRRREKAAASGS